MMAQGNAGARLDLQVLHHGHAAPEAAAAASAYGGVTGAGYLVLLHKPLPFPSRAGYNYAPSAAVRLQDLPEQLRRQITGGCGQGAAAGAGGFYDARAAGAHRDDEGAERHLLQVLRAARPVAGVPEGLSRQLAGVASRPNDDPAVMFAGAFETEDGSMRAWMELFGGGAPSIRRGADAEVGALYGVGGLHAPLLHKNPADGEMDAFDGNGVPARENAALLLLKNKAADGDMGALYITGLPAPEYPDGLVVVFPGEDDASPLLHDSDRAAEDGAHHYYNSGVLVPSPENLMPAWEVTRSPTYAVQVSVDAVAGAKAGDPIAVDVKADAGQDDAGHDHDNLSAVVGIVAASSAATALAAGAVGPVTAFGLFAVLVGGLSMAMASVRAA